MKTNVSIELDDDARRLLADLIDRKQTQRLATRAEIVAIARQHIGGLTAPADPQPADSLHPSVAETKSKLYQVDPADRALMAQPDNPSYVRGWNQVKHGIA